MLKEDEKSKEIVLVGSTGFVGSKVASLLSEKQIHLVLPSKNELNITSSRSIKQYMLSMKPKTLINFAAYTNIEKAEKQRRNKSGQVWKINVDGPKKLAKLCRKSGIFFIHISTDSVFPGTEESPGPYKEDAIPPPSQKHLSWYSYTKLLGEQAAINSGARYAIIRISYPFGNLHSKKDFLIKTLEYIKSGARLFTDQNFTPTYIPDLAELIAILVTLEKKGIYHAACTGITSPHRFANYVRKKLDLKNKIYRQEISDYLNKPNYTYRSKFGGLLNKITQKSLNLKFSSWHRAIDDCLSQDNLFFIEQTKIIKQLST